MGAITKETRRESHNKTDKQPLRKAVLDTLGNDILTAREIAEKMYKAGVLPYPARAIIQPRITELEKEGVIKAVGKRKDTITDRKVAAYRRNEF